MNNGEKDVQDLISAFLNEIGSFGLKDGMLNTYRRICSDIQKIAEKQKIKCFSDDFACKCSAELLEMLPDCHRTTINRIIRILGELAQNGTADFSPDYSQRGRYHVQTSVAKLVESILDHHSLLGRKRKEMSTTIRHLFIFSEGKGVPASEISDRVIMDFIKDELPKTNKSSMDRAMMAVRYATAYLKTSGKGNVSLDFSQLRAKNGRARVVPPYSKEEIRRILDAVDTSKPAGRRDYAMILLSYETGLRSADIRSLRLSDIDWKKGTVSVCQSKTSVPVTLPMSGRAMNAVADYVLHSRPECGYEEVFLNIRGTARPINMKYYGFSCLIDRYCKKAGGPKIERRSFHSLRRSFATRMSESGVPIETISEMLGHTSIQSDKPYLSYSRDQISFCAIGFEELPIKHGVYAAGKEDPYGKA